MPDIGTKSEREVGRVIAVSNYRVTVLLDSEVRSQIRSFPYQITTITQIGGYLLFPVSPGESVVGIIIWASENEMIEPDEEKGVTLQLARARRILKLNLIGQLREHEPFKPGVSVYPNLDTSALLPAHSELKSILEFQPKEEQQELDTPLPLGHSSVYTGQDVTCSFNDILARPLGVIGNTGSGKSWSVASLIQSSLEKLSGQIKNASGEAYPKPKFIILDINGEYKNAFPSKATSGSSTRGLNEVYINDEPFVLPLWALNLNEIEYYFEASQASQKPVLERVVTTIRERVADPSGGEKLREILGEVENSFANLDVVHKNTCFPTEAYVKSKVKALYGHIRSSISKMKPLLAEFDFEYPDKLQEFEDTECDSEVSGSSDHELSPQSVTEIQQRINSLKMNLEKIKQAVLTRGIIKPITADSPVPFDPKILLKDEPFTTVISRFRGQERIQEYIATLRLRIQRKLADKRWHIFSDVGDTFENLLKKMIGTDTDFVNVVDCSMLANDVLPYFCAVFGRILLELRGHAEREKRIVQPYVLVLEEAHNYLKPPREGEPLGLRLARETFERIAKEGRKFGLSLIVASQRPSDVSATVLSQCANFIVHRIQNPEDIDYFKKVLPLGSRDLMDQVPILAPGDGLLMGSSVNVPVRVKVKKPVPPPMSETPRPWEAWQPMKDIFDIKESMNLWLRESEPEGEVDLPKLSKKKKTDTENDQ